MMRESSIETKLRKKIKAMGGLCLKWVCPGHSGVPDRIILLPGARIYFVETKVKGEKPSMLQGVWLDRLRSLGFNADYIAGPEQVNTFIDSLKST